MNGTGKSEPARVEILSGPDRLEFLMAIARGMKEKPLIFMVGSKNTLVLLSLSSIEREDDSGESFNFTGRDRSSKRRLRGYYHTSLVKGGHIEYLS